MLEELLECETLGNLPHAALCAAAMPQRAAGRGAGGGVREGDGAGQGFYELFALKPLLLSSQEGRQGGSVAARALAKTRPLRPHISEENIPR